jgi:hypothetical protein
MKERKYWKLALGSLLLISLLMIVINPGIAADKYEKISGRMYGTSTQMGRNASFDLTIFQPSTPEDREVLVAAFKKGQSEGLFDALEKMKPVGRIAITGTLGYDVSYIKVIPTETGRKIRFVTNRLIRFGEAAQNTQSKNYNLTAGELDLNDQDMKKSTGTLLPAAQLIINDKGELQWELYQNPWRVSGITDWKPKPE